MQRAVLVDEDLDKIKSLIAAGLNPNAPIGCGTFAPLDGAVEKGNVEMAALLISVGAKPTEGQMVDAAFFRNPDVALQFVKLFQKAGDPVNARRYYDKTRFNTPIHQAVWRQNRDLVAYLLSQKGIQLDLLNVDGYTPLMIAVEHGDDDLVKMLLAAGANPKIRNQDGLDAAGVAARVIEKQQSILKQLSNG